MLQPVHKNPIKVAHLKVQTVLVGFSVFLLNLTILNLCKNIWNFKKKWQRKVQHNHPHRCILYVLNYCSLSWNTKNCKKDITILKTQKKSKLSFNILMPLKSKKQDICSISQLTHQGQAHSPVLSRAPKIHSWYMEFSMLSSGGGSMKWKRSKSWTPKDFNNNTTLARLVLWISGMVVVSISFL